MNFRKALSSDAEAIYNIEKAVQLNPWSVKQIDSEIDAARSIVAVSTEGTIQGYVFYRGSQGQYDLTNIAVAGSKLGSGVGKKLIDQMLTDISSQLSNSTQQTK